jgi:hypothetical protein
MTADRNLDDLIAQAAESAGIDPALLLAAALKESGIDEARRCVRDRKRSFTAPPPFNAR